MRGLEPCEHTTELIKKAIVDDPPATLSTPGVIRSGFSAELDHIRTASRDAKNWVANLEQTERTRLKMQKIQVSFKTTNQYSLTSEEVYKATMREIPLPN